MEESFQMKRTRKKRNNKLGLVGVIIAFILISMVAAGLVYFEDLFIPSKVLSEQEYFKVDEDKVAILHNYELQSATAVLENNSIYIPLAWYSKLVDDKFYYSMAEKQVIITRADEIVKLKFSDKDAQGKNVFIQKGDTMYMLLDKIKEYSDIIAEDYTNLEVKRVNIVNIFGDYRVAKVKSNTRVFASDSIRSDTVKKLDKDEEVKILENLTEEEFSNKKWLKVTASEGFTGFIRKSKLVDYETKNLASQFNAPVYTSLQLGEKVILGWHLVSNKESNDYFEDIVKNTSGMNVISPTWFALADNEGNYKSYASADYVKKAHDKGLMVWALLDNFNKKVDSEKLFSKTSNREKLIEQLIKDVKEYKIDGINIDFETLKQDAIIHYIQFIRELSVACRKEEIFLTVDVPNYENFNGFYQRDKLAEVTDYIINMGYDEHYVGSDKGSVASIEYVKRGIDNTLNEVSADKLINAIPFYTRVWTEKKSKVTSKALGIEASKTWVEENNVTLNWDDTIGQYYGSIETNEGTKHIWLEDDKSLELKINYMKEKNLAGVAGWRLGLDSKEIWETVIKMK